MGSLWGCLLRRLGDSQSTRVSLASPHRGVGAYKGHPAPPEDWSQGLWAGEDCGRWGHFKVQQDIEGGNNKQSLLAQVSLPPEVPGLTGVGLALPLHFLPLFLPHFREFSRPGGLAGRGQKGRQPRAGLLWPQPPGLRSWSPSSKSTLLGLPSFQHTQPTLPSCLQADPARNQGLKF